MRWKGEFHWERREAVERERRRGRANGIVGNWRSGRVKNIKRKRIKEDKENLQEIVTMQ